MLLKKRQLSNFRLIEIFLLYRRYAILLLANIFFISQYLGEILKYLMLFVIKLEFLHFLNFFFLELI